MFLVDGSRFHAHRIALLASSDAFHAMFSSGYREASASQEPIPIRGIRWAVFEAMMHYCYTGGVEVADDVALELLQARAAPAPPARSRAAA